MINTIISFSMAKVLGFEPLTDEELLDINGGACVGRVTVNPNYGSSCTPDCVGPGGYKPPPPPRPCGK